MPGRFNVSRARIKTAVPATTISALLGPIPSVFLRSPMSILESCAIQLANLRGLRPLLIGFIALGTRHSVYRANDGGSSRRRADHAIE